MVKNRLLATVALALLACQGSGVAVSDPGQSPIAAGSSSAVARHSETIELDFDEAGGRGSVLFRIPFGEGKSSVGRIPPCMDEGCPSPCPCTTQLIPFSFAPTRRGGAWILDPAKERLARFSSQGEFLRKVRIPGNDRRNFDVVVSDRNPLVLGQRLDFSARLVRFNSDRPEVQSLRYKSEAAEAYRLTSSQDRLFSTLFVEDANMDVEEVPVEIRRGGTATEVPGVPFLDGWMIHQDYAGPTTIPLEVRSTMYDWQAEIEAILVREVNGEKREVPGSLSWEFAVSGEGDVHLLVRAQTEKGGSIDGFWWVPVSREGFVGKPLKLRGPRRSDDQQQRHLALGYDNRPVMMWVGKKGLIFESLPSAAMAAP